MIVGLTGGIGSGKTTVANFFATYGVDIIDADLISRELVQPNTPGLKMISQLFGKAFLLPSGELDRTRLRQAIFNDPLKKEQLNSILHPLIREEIMKRISMVQSDYALLVVPLLIEGNYQHLCDRILVIDMSNETQLERTTKRDQIDPVLAQKMIDAQASREERFLAATDIINNETTIERVKQQVALLHQQFLALATAEN